MSSDRHFTTRRGFVGAMGFGALGLYVTWAAYGASPLPFGSADVSADPHAGGSAGGGAHAGHGAPSGDAEPAMAEMHGASGLSAHEFEERHAAFLQRFRQADGSIHPTADTTPHDDHASPATHQMTADMPGMTHAGHDMPAAASDAHAGHGMPDAAGHADHGAPPTATADAHDHTAPIEIYLAAGRFSFEPDDLRLDVGRAYRFHMMATDVAHGASIAFGSASRIVRLRPDTVTTLDLTFREAGRHLVYCTVYCGPGHDAMHAQITVA